MDFVRELAKNMNFLVVSGLIKAEFLLSTGAKYPHNLSKEAKLYFGKNWNFLTSQLPNMQIGVLIFEILG